jgi:hypothetical protein
VLTLAEAARGPLGLGFVLGFPASEEFHDAIREERGLPAAFGAWAEKQARESMDGVTAASAVLEATMVRARRGQRPCATPAPGEVALSSSAWLVTLPSGALDRAQEVRAAIDAGGDVPPPAPELLARATAWLESRAEAARHADATCETVLLVVVEDPPNYRLLREIAPERLEPDAAELLRAALTPLDATALAKLGAGREWSADVVEDFVSALVAEGVLRRG